MLRNLIFILFSILSCIGYQDGQILSFEYQAATRGYSEKVIIRKDSTFVLIQDEVTKMITKKMDWVLLNQEIVKIDLKKLEVFEAPTKERYSDKTLSAKLIVTSKSHSYETAEFDHGNSPEEINEIVEVLTRYLLLE